MAMGGPIRAGVVAGAVGAAALTSAGLTPARSADFPVKAPTAAQEVASRWSGAFATEVRNFSRTGDRG
jgi:hypothetical protein